PDLKVLAEGHDLDLEIGEAEAVDHLPLAAAVRDACRAELLNPQVAPDGDHLHLEIREADRVDLLNLAPEVLAIQRAVALHAAAHRDGGTARATCSHRPPGSRGAACVADRATRSRYTTDSRA